MRSKQQLAINARLLWFQNQSKAFNYFPSFFRVMLRVSFRKSKTYKIRLEQKSKMSKTIKSKRLSEDDGRGAVNVWAASNAYVSEKAIIGVQMALKRTSQKAGIVWTKPIHIKTTTKKGEKRLGKGKGALVTYNRTARVRAGACIFEVGSIADFSNKVLPTNAQMRTVNSKLPFNLKLEHRAGLSARLSRSDKLVYCCFS